MAVADKHKGIIKRGSIYYIDTSFKGVPIRKKAGPSLQDAFDELTRIKGDIAKGKNKKPAYCSLTIKKLLEFGWETKYQYQASRETVKWHFTRLANEFGHRKVFDIRKADIMSYARKRFRQKNANKQYPKHRTVMAELEYLHMAVEWGIDNEMIDYNPLSRFKKVLKTEFPKPEEQEPVILDEGVENGAEWRKLLNAFSGKRHEYIRPAIIILYETGMRKNELRQLRWKWIDMIEGDIHLPGVFEGQPVTKSRKSRHIPISDSCRDALMSIPQRSEFVVLNSSGEPYVSSYWLDKIFSRGVNRAGLPDNITPHVLRKTRATIWNEIDERAAMKALGHTDFETHRKSYAKTTIRRVKKLVFPQGIPQVSDTQPEALTGSGL